MTSVPPPAGTIKTLADLAEAAGAEVAELLTLSPGELNEMLVSEFQLGVIARKRIATEHAEAVAAFIPPAPAVVAPAPAPSSPAPATPAAAVIVTAPAGGGGGLSSSLLAPSPQPTSFGIVAPLMELLDSANVCPARPAFRVIGGTHLCTSSHQRQSALIASLPAADFILHFSCGNTTARSKAWGTLKLTTST